MFSHELINQLNCFKKSTHTNSRSSTIRKAENVSCMVKQIFRVVLELSNMLVHTTRWGAHPPVPLNRSAPDLIDGK